MKLISWNVNGLRACIGKGFLDFVNFIDADVICLQETKLQPHQIELDLPQYHIYWNSADKKGYSGTAVFTKQEPLSVTYDFGEDIHRHEGRVITCEYPDFYLVCCYTPNSQNELRRLSYRMEWEDALRQYLCELDTIKPVVYCGDLNVAHEEIDLKNPKTNHFNPGFSDEERGKMTQLLSSGFLDSFRTLYPDKTDAYSWWSYRAQSRARNVGWRIDYFIVSERLRSRIENADILAEVMGSDHCPCCSSSRRKKNETQQAGNDRRHEDHPDHQRCGHACRHRDRCAVCRRRARPFRAEPQRARDCDLRRAGGVFLHAVQIVGGT